MFWRIRYLIKSVTNLFYYFKTVWRDRDWDSQYYYYLLLTKIRKQRKRYEKYDLFVGQKYVVVQMRACEIILDRIINDWYFEQTDKDNEESYKKWIDREKYEHDLLFKILGKYIKHWWD